MNAKIIVLLVCAFLVMSYGYSQPKGPESSVNTTEAACFDDSTFDGLPVDRETQTKTLARILAESEALKAIVHGSVQKEWYGSALLGLGRLRKVTVPHVPVGSGSEALEVTNPQIHKALTEYVLIDHEKFYSSTHIPKGTIVTIEYENGVVGWINMHAGIPYDVGLQKDGIVGKYGLGKTSDQDAQSDANNSGR